MPLQITSTVVDNVLTRSSGYLQSVCSHSLQPYRGCTFGSALCGAGCYVRHNRFLTQGREWGTFLDVKTNAAAAYERYYAREQNWARQQRGHFCLFCSSSTDPFLPQERRFRVTHQLLQSMLRLPPDELILQTHSDHVVDELKAIITLQSRCRVRVHISIESDLDRLPGLPPPACSVERRLSACNVLRQHGIPVVVTVAPLLPIQDPESFFQRIAEVADAVVIDHFIGGDGSRNGTRTRQTSLPSSMAGVNPESVQLSYRDEMIDVAQRFLSGRVGVGIDGFAGRFR